VGAHKRSQTRRAADTAVEPQVGEAGALDRQAMHAPSDATHDRIAQLGNENHNALRKCSPTLVMRTAGMYRP
jgi:hypothetical protein